MATTYTKLTNIILNHLDVIEKNAISLAKSFKTNKLPIITIKELLTRAKIEPKNYEAFKERQQELILKFFTDWNAVVDQMEKTTISMALGKNVMVKDFKKVIKAVRLKFMEMRKQELNKSKKV